MNYLSINLCCIAVECNLYENFSKEKKIMTERKSENFKFWNVGFSFFGIYIEEKFAHHLLIII